MKPLNSNCCVFGKKRVFRTAFFKVYIVQLVCADYKILLKDAMCDMYQAYVQICGYMFVIPDICELLTDLEGVRRV